MTRIILGTEKGLRNAGGTTDPLDGAAVTTLSADGEILWAVVANRHLYRCDDDGARRVATLPDVTGWCLLAHAGAVWIGTSGAHLFRFADGQLQHVTSFESAPSRDDWYHPGGHEPGVWSLAGDGERLYVNVHVGGILASDDGGATWTPTIDLHTDVHQVIAVDRGRLWAATGMNALAESDDAGRNWDFHRRGLHAPYLTAAAPTSDGVLVAASSGHRAVDGAVYRFDGAGFTLCDDGLPTRFGATLETRCLTAKGREAVLADTNGGVYFSSDRGRKWNMIEKGLPRIHAVVLH